MKQCKVSYAIGRRSWYSFDKLEAPRFAQLFAQRLTRNETGEHRLMKCMTSDRWVATTYPATSVCHFVRQAFWCRMPSKRSAGYLSFNCSVWRPLFKQPISQYSFFRTGKLFLILKLKFKPLLALISNERRNVCFCSLMACNIVNFAYRFTSPSCILLVSFWTLGSSFQESSRRSDPRQKMV